MKNLAHLGFNSQDSLGRALPAALDQDRNLYFMDHFELDLTKILRSYALAAQKGKTQVFSGLGNICITDRLIHSFQVASDCLESAVRLSLNKWLLYASGVVHDVGHFPMGHLAERFLSKKLGEYFGHERFVIFRLEIVERDGLGLNLSYELLRIIRDHSRGAGELSIGNHEIVEGDVLVICDKKYIIHDYADVDLLGQNDSEIFDAMMKLGKNKIERSHNVSQSFWKESLQNGKISFSNQDFIQAKKIMYQNVYHKMDGMSDRAHITDILERVYSYFLGYFGSNRAAALAIALSSENDIYALDILLRSRGTAIINQKINDYATFSFSKFLTKIPYWSELDFCNPDIFLQKNNFGNKDFDEAAKMQCFTR